MYLYAEQIDPILIQFACGLGYACSERKRFTGVLFVFSQASFFSIMFTTIHELEYCAAKNILNEFKWNKIMKCQNLSYGKIMKILSCQEIKDHHLTINVGIQEAACLRGTDLIILLPLYHLQFFSFYEILLTGHI